MNRYAGSVLKFLAYTVASLVILLAVAVGLLRLMLPELPEYRDQIQARASEATGLGVEFERLDARWRFSGPELIFQGVTIADPDTGETLLNADEISVGAAFLRMLRERRIVVGRIGVTGTALSVDRTSDGGLTIQGRRMDAGGEASGAALPRRIRVTLADVSVTYTDATTRGGPLRLRLTSLEWLRDGDNQELELEVDPDSDLAEQVQLMANGRSGGDPRWELYLQTRALNLGRVASILPEEWPSPRSGSADLEIWASLEEGSLRRATANVDVVSLVPATDASIVPYDVRARLEWALRERGWLAAVNELSIARGGELRPESFLQVSAERDAEGALTGLEVQSAYLNMADVMPLGRWLPSAISETLADLDPTGELLSLNLGLDDLGGPSLRYSIEADLREAGVAARDARPGARGITGSIRADESNGRLTLDSRSLTVDAPALLLAPVGFRRADATVVWRRSDRELAVLCDRLVLEDDSLTTESSFQLDIPLGQEGESPRLDLTAEWRLSDLSVTPRYLPAKIMPPALYEWFDKALVAGRAESGSLAFDGRLSDFPFDDGQGVFRAGASIRDATLRFALEWPDIEELDAKVSLEGMRLVTTENSATTMGNRLENAYVGFEDLRKGMLEIRGSGTGTLDRIVAYAEASPISSIFAGRLADVSAAGQGRVDIDLGIPVMRVEDYDIRARIATDDGRFALAGFPHPLTEVSGAVTVTRAGAVGEDISASFLGGRASIDVLPAGADEPELSTLVVATSRVSAESLVETAGIPLAGELIGDAAYGATVRFPRPGLETGPPVAIRLESELRGLGIGLPAPFSKDAEDIVRFATDIRFPEEGRIEVGGYFGQTAKWLIAVGRGQDGWVLDRGNVHLGPGLARLPAGTGMHFSGRLDSLRLGDWLARAAAPGREAGAAWIRSADIAVGDLYAFGQLVRGVELQLERNASDWMVQVGSSTVDGSIIVPTDLDSGRSVVLDMERLHIVEADPMADDPGSPAEYPPIDVRAADFRLGEREFGTLTATLQRTERGLRSEDLTADAPSFSFAGTAAWLVDLTDPAGQRSMLSGELTSTDVEETLSRLGYDPGIAADSGSARIDLSISGPPRSEFLDELDGEVGIAMENGRLDEVEPGAGRVFGLLSVTALPRRLSLDFRDVFDKGLGFDAITGTFRMVNGDAYTCDLTLKSSVADIGVVGRAGLAQRDYNQTAIVSANVGSTLPAVGAVVAGPQVAAALLVFSQIFKKPLQELAQAYYQVSGDFDDPTIERTDARRFAATSELAGCLTPTP